MYFSGLAGGRSLRAGVRLWQGREKRETLVYNYFSKACDCIRALVCVSAVLGFFTVCIYFLVTSLYLFFASVTLFVRNIYRLWFLQLIFVELHLWCDIFSDCMFCGKVVMLLALALFVGIQNASFGF